MCEDIKAQAYAPSVVKSSTREYQTFNGKGIASGLMRPQAGSCFLPDNKLSPALALQLLQVANIASSQFHISPHVYETHLCHNWAAQNTQAWAWFADYASDHPSLCESSLALQVPGERERRWGRACTTEPRCPGAPHGSPRESCFQGTLNVEHTGSPDNICRGGAAERRSWERR